MVPRLPGISTASVTLADREFCCVVYGHKADRDLNAATNLAIWAEQHHARIRDPEVRGPVTNAYRGTALAGTPQRADETSPDDVGTQPPHRPHQAGRWQGRPRRALFHSPNRLLKQAVERSTCLAPRNFALLKGVLVETERMAALRPPPVCTSK
jgi:hypothetical protein